MFYYNFLNQYLRHGFASNGLTLPFLLGVKEEYTKIRELINDLNSLDDNHYISVQYCYCIKEYVFGVFNDEGDLNIYNKFTSIIILDENISTDYETFISDMENMYQDKIDSHTFSKLNGNWLAYTDDDKARVKICSYL